MDVSVTDNISKPEPLLLFTEKFSVFLGVIWKTTHDESVQDEESNTHNIVLDINQNKDNGRGGFNMSVE